MSIADCNPIDSIGKGAQQQMYLHSNKFMSPICSCVICRKITSIKGIHSHYLYSHTEEGKSKQLKASKAGKNKAIESAHKKKQQKTQNFKKECEQCHKNLSYKQRNNRFCSHSCATSFANTGKERSEKTKQKLSLYAKLHPSGVIIATPENKKIHSQKRSNTLAKRRQVIACAECKQEFTVSKSAKRTYCSRECANKNRYHSNSTQVHRSIYSGYQMDSGAELYFAKLLDQHGIKWQKNSTVYFEYSPGRRYFPDFFLPEYNAWVEIKGKRYVRPNDQLRWNSVPKLEVIWSHNMKLPKCVMAEVTGNDPA